MSDHILDELKAIKDGLAKECGFDLGRLFEKLKSSQHSAAGNIVNRTKGHPSKPDSRNAE